MEIVRIERYAWAFFPSFFVTVYVRQDFCCVSCLCEMETEILKYWYVGRWTRTAVAVVVATI